MSSNRIGKGKTSIGGYLASRCPPIRDDEQELIEKLITGDYADESEKAQIISYIISSMTRIAISIVSYMASRTKITQSELVAQAMLYLAEGVHRLPKHCPQYQNKGGNKYVYKHIRLQLTKFISTDSLVPVPWESQRSGNLVPKLFDEYEFEAVQDGSLEREEQSQAIMDKIMAACDKTSDPRNARALCLAYLQEGVLTQAAILIGISRKKATRLMNQIRDNLS